MHVCGNNGLQGNAWGKNTQITGNVTKTYKSGTAVTMSAIVILFHMYIPRDIYFESLVHKAILTFFY